MSYYSTITAAIEKAPSWMNYEFFPRKFRTGHGSKIPTSYMVRLKNHSRWYRVYGRCFGNGSTLYVISQGKELSINSLDISELLKK